MNGMLPITFLICIIWIFTHSKKLRDRYNMYYNCIQLYSPVWTTQCRVRFIQQIFPTAWMTVYYAQNDNGSVSKGRDRFELNVFVTLNKF